MFQGITASYSQPHCLPRAISISVSVSPDLIVIPLDPLGCCKPSVFLLCNHLLQTGLVLDERWEDHEDVADVRNKVSEGAVEEDWRYLPSLNINMNPRYDWLGLAIYFLRVWSS